MSQGPILIDSLAIAGYRSFGKEIQRFENFTKVNLFIGQNNCGKSNVLRFIHKVFTKIVRGKYEYTDLDRPINTDSQLIMGLASKEKEEGHFILNRNAKLLEQLDQILNEKRKIDQTNVVWFDFESNLKLIEDDWKKAINIISKSDNYYFHKIWPRINNDFNQKLKHKDARSEEDYTPYLPNSHSILIPAIRKVGDKGSISEEFSGEGIIERLAKIQNPDVNSQTDKEKFNQINEFLRWVTSNQEATIEIPHERDTILVHMDQKTLPLDNLGTGLHEVIILAVAATVLEDKVICIEEPELHLNPILQKKLVRYLKEKTNNQYFISTHSAALMDMPEAEIYHIYLENGESKVSRATTDRHKSDVCYDLGYHPSDLLQANCIIWVEGPSDRLYINYWLAATTNKFVEGIHYSIMFYGGKLNAHLSADDLDEILDDFISLRRINRHSTIVIDSDKQKQSARINSTKKRLKKEFDKGPGFTWITQGKEIENYLPSENIKAVIEHVHPKMKISSNMEKFENPLRIENRKGEKSQAEKVRVARHITENFEPDFSRLDLKTQINKLVEFIEEANPSVHVL